MGGIVKAYPAHFLRKPMFLRYLILGCLFLIPVARVASHNAAPQGFLEGHLIVSLSEVEPSDEVPRPAVTARMYTEYPLIISSQDEKRNRAGDCGREWKLSHCAAARRLYSGRARAAA
jgi:hypothetical protein